jgi:hypothetical protein
MMPSNISGNDDVLNVRSDVWYIFNYILYCIINNRPKWLNKLLRDLQTTIIHAFLFSTYELHAQSVTTSQKHMLTHVDCAQSDFHYQGRARLL